MFPIIYRNYDITKYRTISSSDKASINIITTILYFLIVCISFVVVSEFLARTEILHGLGFFSYPERDEWTRKNVLGKFQDSKLIIGFIVLAKILVSHIIASLLTAIFAFSLLNKKYSEMQEKNRFAMVTRQQLDRERQEEEQRRAYNRQLKEIEEKEYVKAKGQSRAMLSLYEGQLSLLQDHKKRGMDIEKESFELRKKLLELERQENSEMINDLLRTLDRI